MAKKKRGNRKGKRKVINNWDEKFDRETILYDMGFKSYKAYMGSTLWIREIRPQVKKKYGGVCQSCNLEMNGTNVPQVVHHREYTKAVLSGESIEGLMLVCKKCHDMAHTQIFGDTSYIRSLTETNEELDRPKAQRSKQISKYANRPRYCRQVKRKTPQTDKDGIKTKFMKCGLKVQQYRQWKKMGSNTCRVVGCDKSVGRRGRRTPPSRSICKRCKKPIKKEELSRKETLEERDSKRYGKWLDNKEKNIADPSQFYLVKPKCKICKVVSDNRKEICTYCKNQQEAMAGKWLGNNNE